jgi:hypothetical protein
MPSPSPIGLTKLFKRSRGRPRTRALKSPNRCAPNVRPRRNCNADECTWVHTSTGKQQNYCRRKTNKRRSV